MSQTGPGPLGFRPAQSRSHPQSITGHIVSSVCGLVAAILVAIKSKNLTLVAIVSCLTVLVIELILMI